MFVAHWIEVSKIWGEISPVFVEAVLKYLGSQVFEISSQWIPLSVLYK